MPDPSHRHQSLDALRGIAVMGILLMNIVFFAMPSSAYINPTAFGGTTDADFAVWAVNLVLVDGKMRGLFSLLFGASLLLVIDRAAAKGEDAGRVHFRRMGWLLLFSLAHYYLIWAGDILFPYAVVGMIAFLFRARDADTLTRWAIGVLIANFAIWALIGVSLLMLQSAASAPGADAAAIASYKATAADLGAPGSALIARELAAYTSGYGAIVGFRTSGEQLYGPAMMILLMGLETLGYMLLGMALLKGGFMTGGWDRAAYLRLARTGYALGIPAMIALAAWCWASGFDPVTTFTVQFVWALPFRVALILAHAALALWLIGRYAAHPVIERIAAAGRAAFTNYLGTSIVMTTIFYGYGIGLYGEVSRIGIYAFVLLGWGLMLWWSKPWLERFAYGPFEWLWRSLARGRLQPMRKSPAEA